MYTCFIHKYILDTRYIYFVLKRCWYIGEDDNLRTGTHKSFLKSLQPKKNVESAIHSSPMQTAGLFWNYYFYIFVFEQKYWVIVYDVMITQAVYPHI